MDEGVEKVVDRLTRNGIEKEQDKFTLYSILAGICFIKDENNDETLYQRIMDEQGDPKCRGKGFTPERGNCVITSSGAIQSQKLKEDASPSHKNCVHGS